MSGSTNQIVFESGFVEGVSPELDPNENSQAQCMRKVIRTEVRFELLYLILHYLYTGNICFSTNLDAEPPTGMPNYCHPEEIFSIAHQFGLEDLQKKALDFLKETCDARNIVERTFGEFGLVHEEVGKMYKDFLLSNWEFIENCELTDYVEKLEEEDSPYRKAAYKRLVEIMKCMRPIHATPQPMNRYPVTIVENLAPSPLSPPPPPPW
jgi:hypothetical protein